MKQEQLYRCPNKQCKYWDTPLRYFYCIKHEKNIYDAKLGHVGKDSFDLSACTDDKGNPCPACIPYEPRKFSEMSACEYLKCKYAGRDTEGKPYCKDTDEYKNAAGEAVCGMIDDAIPVEPEYECTTPEDRDFPMYLRKAEIEEAQHEGKMQREDIYPCRPA